MAVQKGRDMLLKVGDGATPTEAFTTVGGIRSKSLSINAETVDISNGDSEGWRELLGQGAGLRSVSLSGSGVFIDDTPIATLTTRALAGTVHNYQLVVPGFGTFEGAFQITALEMSGEFNAEVAQTITLESADTIAFTAA